MPRPSAQQPNESYQRTGLCRPWDNVATCRRAASAFKLLLTTEWPGPPEEGMLALRRTGMERPQTQESTENELVGKKRKETVTI